VLQLITAFVYCNRLVAPAGRRWQARDATRRLRNWTRPWTPPTL